MAPQNCRSAPENCVQWLSTLCQCAYHCFPSNALPWLHFRVTHNFLSKTSLKPGFRRNKKSHDRLVFPSFHWRIADVSAVKQRPWRQKWTIEAAVQDVELRVVVVEAWAPKIYPRVTLASASTLLGSVVRREEEEENWLYLWRES